MRSPRSVAYSILIYSAILAASLIVLSIMSMTAYSCGFDFKLSSVTYMLHLIYYRTDRCHSEINWGVLGVNRNVSVELQASPETQAVFRTFIFSLSYLILSILLVITCVLALCGLRRTGKWRHLIFWLYFVPFIVIFISIIVMDLMTSGFYLVDYFSTLNVNGLMRVMEVWNTDEIRPILEQIPITTRSLPAIIMFAATSKCILFLIVSFFIIFAFVPAAWQICTENEDIIKTIYKVENEREPVAPVTPRAHDVNVTVSHVAPTAEEPQVQPPPEPQEPQEPFIEPQPAYNPFLTISSRKEETKF